MITRPVGDRDHVAHALLDLVHFAISSFDQRFRTVLVQPRRRGLSATNYRSPILAHHVSPVHSNAISKMTKAPGATRSNVNSKNGVKCVMRLIYWWLNGKQIAPAATPNRSWASTLF